MKSAVFFFSIIVDPLVDAQAIVLGLIVGLSVFATLRQQ